MELEEVGLGGSKIHAFIDQWSRDGSVNQSYRVSKWVGGRVRPKHQTNNNLHTWSRWRVRIAFTGIAQGAGGGLARCVKAIHFVHGGGGGV